MPVGFTLMEIIVVLVIVGILATLGIANFTRTRGYSLDREAAANLRLIQAAERVYQQENGFYFPRNAQTGTLVDINNFLKLNLSAGGNWGYNVDGTTGCSDARRAGQNWKLDIGTDNPVSGTCF